MFFFHLQTLGCKPIASLDHFTADMLGSAELVEEVSVGTGKVVKVTAEKHHKLLGFTHRTSGGVEDLVRGCDTSISSVFFTGDWHCKPR